MSTLGKDWFEGQSEHALAVAKYGDIIFDIVQEGAQDLQSKWQADARDWNDLIDRAVQGSLLDRLFRDPLDRDWLSQTLFKPTRQWPSGLTNAEVQILELVRAASALHPLHAQGVKVDKLLNPDDPDYGLQEAALVKAMKKYSGLVYKNITIPMWKSYDAAAKNAARKIAPMCEEVYGETCSQDEAVLMFKGDLQRGWKMKTLKMDPSMYQVFPKFLSWISA
jgi:hypothetical protein